MDQNRKITLEQLLALKRAERPSPEFWENFDRELRSKQLAALVKTRPWWQVWTPKKTLVRICMPLGAAAAVAVAFSSTQRVVVNRAPAQVAHVELSRSVAEVKPLETLSNQTVVATASAAAAVDASRLEDASVNARVTEPIASAKAQDAAGAVWATGAATMKAAGQALAQLTGLSEEQTTEVAVAQPKVVEPLAQVATPRDSRRSRLLAYSVAYDPHAANSADSARSREHITRRMSDDAVYDSISRLGVSGNSVSIKF